MKCCKSQSELLDSNDSHMLCRTLSPGYFRHNHKAFTLVNSFFNLFFFNISLASIVYLSHFQFNWIFSFFHVGVVEGLFIYLFLIPALIWSLKNSKGTQQAPVRAIPLCGTARGMHTITLHLTEALQKLVYSDKSNDIPNQHYQGATALTFTPVEFQLVWGNRNGNKLIAVAELQWEGSDCWKHWELWQDPAEGVGSSCATPALCWQGINRGVDSRVPNLGQAVLEEVQLSDTTMAFYKPVYTQAFSP